MPIEHRSSYAVPARPSESRDPSTGERWRSFAAASLAEIAETVARAREAQAAWGACPVADRVAKLRRFHDVLFRRRLEVAAMLTRENGKPTAEAMSTEVAVVLDMASYYAGHTPRFLRAPWFSASALAMKRKRIRVLREPFGVVAVISPWNYPFMLSAAIVVPALATGNAVLLKPSELTPSIGALLAELLYEAGVPRDVFSVLQGDGTTGAALVEAEVDKVFFTGSVAAGRSVALRCAERLIPCGLELGGSDAAIVLADADVTHAASGIAFGRFSNGGQTCVAPKRVFVEHAAYDAFVEAMRVTLAALRVGPGANPDTDVGPMIRERAVAALAAQRDDATARGATVITSRMPGATAPAMSGAESPVVPSTGDGVGRYFPPTVLLNVAAESMVLNEETFGPLLPVVCVRDADDAVARANATEFGLSASIWSRDTARATLLAERLVAGSVTINDSIVTAGMADVPHGGLRQSGMGRTHGMAGLEECVRTKAIVADRFPAWRQGWWFGYSREHAAGVDAFVRLAHSTSLWERASAIPAFLRLLFAPSRPV